jgi:hypothetical protein
MGCRVIEAPARKRPVPDGVNDSSNRGCGVGRHQQYVSTGAECGDGGSAGRVTVGDRRHLESIGHDQPMKSESLPKQTGDVWAGQARRHPWVEGLQGDVANHHRWGVPADGVAKRHQVASAQCGQRLALDGQRVVTVLRHAAVTWEVFDDRNDPGGPVAAHGGFDHRSNGPRVAASRP